MNTIARRTIIIVAIGLSVFLFLQMSSVSVSALSNTFADSDQNGSTTVVSETGAHIQLDAPASFYTIYSKTTDFDILLTDFCMKFNGNGYARATLYANDANETHITLDARNKTIHNSSCWVDPPYAAGAHHNATLVMNGATKSTVEGHGDYYTATLIVEKVKANGTAALDGITAYTVSTPSASARIVFNELSIAAASNKNEPATKSFAMVSDDFPDGPEKNYTLKFGTPCSVKANTTVYLKWDDADIGAGNEDGDLSFKLRKSAKSPDSWTDVGLTVYDDSGTKISPDNVETVNSSWLGGNGAGSFRAAEFILEPDYKYEWIWSLADGNNGIQLWMPFSGINYDITCDSGSWDYDTSMLSIVNVTDSAWTKFYPTNEFDVNAKALSNSSSETTGLDYAYRISSHEGESYLEDIKESDLDPAWDSTVNSPYDTDPITSKDFRWGEEDGLAVGGSKNYTGEFQLKLDTPHNEEFCFKSWIAPSAGEGDTVTEDWEVSNPAPDKGLCFNVYNLRFDINEPTITFSKTSVQPGESVTITYTVKNSELPLPAGSTRGPAPSVNIKTIADVGINPGVDVNLVKLDPSASHTETVTVTIPETVTVGQSVCTTVEVNKNRGFSDGTDLAGGPQTKRKCIVVSAKPYLQVNNGDIWAGANFDTEVMKNVSPSCGVDNADAEIRTVRSNLPTGLPTLYRGSFVEYAAFATGDISQFASAIPDAKYKTQPAIANDLTFENSTSLGNFTSNPRCIPNFFGLLYGDDPAGKKINASTFTLGSKGANKSGQWWRDGNLKINGTGTDLEIDKDMTLVVNGDVYLRANGGNTTIAFNDKYTRDAAGDIQIPSLVIVAKGNIFIDEDMTQIDAILIAHGQVWTCAEPDGAIKLAPVTDPDTSRCTEQLTINGAIIANRINFMRTYGIEGGVHDPASEPSEIINYTPEFYLSNPRFESNVAELNELRTMLFKDLPPVY